MYCKKCGNPINETDHSCKICGAPTSAVSPAEPAESEAAQAEGMEENEEKKPVHHTEFNWNVYDFPKPKKTEELKLEWPSSAEEKSGVKDTKKGEQRTGEASAEEAHETGRILDAGAAETAPAEEPAPTPETQAEPARPAIAKPAPEKKAEAEVVRAESVRNIEKFFTFTKKNEEFQQLLDREYEKLKNGADGGSCIEPDLDFTHPVLDSFPAPALSDGDRELERMILEGTTSAEEAAPIEDLLHRRTIPVDLAKIQREARKAEEARNRPEPAKPETDEIPSFSIPRKNVDEIGTEYDVNSAAAEQAETAAEEEECRQAAPADIGAAAEESVGAPELSPDDELAKQLSEMAAARESLLRQLAEEKEALRRAEEEAARRVRRQQELNAAGLRREPPRSAAPEMIVNRSVPAANAEIQVTVAVKAGGGVNPQETVSVISTPAAADPTAYVPAAGPYQMETQGAAGPIPHMGGADAHRPPHVIDAEAVEVTESAAAPIGAGRRSAAGRQAGALRPAEEKAAAADAGEARETPAGMDEPWHENTLNSLFAVEPQVQEDNEGGDEKRRVGTAKVILIIIAVILAVEILALGIKYIAPESAAAEAVRGVEVKIVKLFSGAADGAKDFFSGLSGGEKDPVPGGDEDGNGSGDPGAEGGLSGAGQDGSGADTGAKPDPVPMADKTALIATQADKNKNIREITASDELAYVSGKNYGYKDINGSKPIENNIWKTLPSGETLYYDREAVGALIAFDSQWQDYVNSGAKDALSLLKEGSKAYHYASTYSGVGKERQSFESLQIGEIRRGDSGSIYIWAKEQIKKTKNGQNKSETVTYDWIYQLEPGEDGMKIVSYTEIR